MMMSHRRRAVPVVFACALWGAGLLATRAHVAAESLPKQLSDGAFWQMIVDFSERSGFFRSDNLISNESAFQHVIPELMRRTARGGVYIGVGPDQNFTYITALEPRMAFVIDIRRQNMLLHLMHKAIIELSDDRADFLSRLFSRARPPNLDRTAVPQALFEAYGAVMPSDALFQKNLQAIMDRLVKHHGFGLTSDDDNAIEYVYRAFYLAGPDLRYSFPQQFGGTSFPSYADLMRETDLLGHNYSYVATEENFQILKQLEHNNLLVPLVGDFGGDKAIRRVGDYLREHGATVTCFYTSNVEQYLFQTDAWSRFFANVSTLPIDETSTFVRAYFNMRSPPQSFTPTLRSQTLLDPIAQLLTAFRAGRIQTYDDVIDRSQ